MRLLLLITDLERGGTPTVVRELAWRLRDAGLEVQVACLSRRGPVADEIEARGIRVTALNARGARDFFPARGRLIDLIHAGQFEVVFSFLVHANVLASSAIPRCRGVRLIQSIQTTQPRPRWHWLAQRWAGRRAEKIIVPSASIADAAHRRSRIIKGKIIVIPNAIDPDALADLRRDPARPIRTVGFLGRLDPIKRVEDLISAMPLTDPSLQLSIFGDGPARGKLDRLIERLRLGGRVTLHGMVNSPREALARIDLLVLPSRAEGMPMVLIEAMSAGIPIIATDVSGIRDVISNEATGLLVPPGDFRALARAINRLCSDADLRRGLIDNAQREVQGRYSWETILPRYLHQLTGGP